MKICKAKNSDGIRCNNRFEPRAPWQIACSPDCAELISKAKREKTDKERAKVTKAELKAAKLAIKPLSYWEARAQAMINKWIVKVRDKDEGCISCGTRKPETQYAAGHYRTRKAARQHRYNPDNIHKQCNMNCNKKLSGNIINYRPALIAKIGQERHDAIINDNSTRRYSIDELQEMTKFYSDKLKGAGIK